MSKIGEGILEVQWCGVIHHGWDFRILEFPGKGISVLGLDGVLSINRVITIGNDRCLNAGNVGKQRIVALPRFPAKTAFFRQKRKLFQQYGGLQGVQPAVDAHQRMPMLDFLAVHPDLAHLFGKGIIGAKDSTAVSVTAQRF